MDIQLLKEKNIVDLTEILNILTQVIAAYIKQVEKEQAIKKKANKSSTDPLKIKIKRSINYEYIFSFIDTPFNTTHSVQAQFQQLCDKLSSSNTALY